MIRERARAYAMLAHSSRAARGRRLARIFETRVNSGACHFLTRKIRGFFNAATAHRDSNRIEPATAAAISRARSVLRSAASARRRSASGLDFDVRRGSVRVESRGAGREWIRDVFGQVVSTSFSLSLPRDRPLSLYLFLLVSLSRARRNVRVLVRVVRSYPRAAIDVNDEDEDDDVRRAVRRHP